MKIHLFISLLFSILATPALCDPDKNLAREMLLCQQIHQEWLRETIELTRQTPGYSPPVAARTFAYLAVGRYESNVELSPDLLSLSGQLAGWERKTWKSEDENLSFPLIANELNFLLLDYFFVNRPYSCNTHIRGIYLNHHLGICARLKPNVENNSMKYAKDLAQEIINWSKTDGADNCWNKNFPTEFEEKMCPGCWKKTQPGFENALQPFWGNNRAFLLSNTSLCKDLTPLPFSTDSSSAFYQENQKLVDLYKTLSTEQKNTAKYWDDSPGVSGTPVGHLFSIALSVAQEQKRTLFDELQLHVLLGVAVNDAVIESWRLKYEFSTIRPISYIQQYIDPKFNTAIPTPPFPEFPSGHSFQAGAGAEIFSFIFSEALSITDKTNAERTDIQGAARFYQNVNLMAQEMSMSRFYGGIHYDYTLKESLIYGRKIGLNTVQQIRFLKN